MQISNIMADYNPWDAVPAEPAAQCSVISQADMNWIVPKISDFSCTLRTLSEIRRDLCISRGIDTTLELSSNDLNYFAGCPLYPLGVSEYTALATRVDCGQPLLDTRMPFDVSAHSQAKTAVAQSMMSRLQKDVKEYADSQNSSAAPKCRSCSWAKAARGSSTSRLTTWHA